MPCHAAHSLQQVPNRLQGSLTENRLTTSQINDFSTVDGIAQSRIRRSEDAKARTAVNPESSFSISQDN
jgi:hypothetical protein